MTAQREWLVRLCLLGVLLWAACTAPAVPDPPHAVEPDAPAQREPASAAAVGAPGTSAAAPSRPPTTATEARPPASAEVAGQPVPERSADTSAVEPVHHIPLHPLRPAAGRTRVVVLDPGHGGPEVGAAAGNGVVEKDVNLTIALKLKDLLEREGMRVVLTRDGDRRATFAADAESSTAYSATRMDVQARVDIANEAQADAFVSIHNNGSTDPGEGGTEVWWDGRRPFAAFNEALARQVLASLVQAIRSAGYPVANRGLKEDTHFRVRQGRSFPIFVLGPPRTGASTTRATQMPAVLGETLFLTNPVEARLLARDDVLAAIARGYRDGLLRYFRLIDDGALTVPPDDLPPEVPNYYDILPPGSQGSGQAAPR